MAQYNLGVPSSSLTNTMGTPGIAGVNTSAGQNNTIASPKYKKTFFQTAGGIALTGGLGALIGMGQRHAEKVKYAKQMEQQGMENLMNMEVAPETQQAYQQSQMLAGQGMDAASQQLAMQEQSRGMNTALRALGTRRSALAGISGLAASSGDFALRLAAQNAMMKRENQMSNIGLKMQYGRDVLGLQQMKNEALINKATADRSRLNQTISSAASAAAQIIPSLFTKSDYRLKDNITLVGKSEEGLNIYTFGYKGEEGLYQGVMAQDLLETKHSNAVHTMDNGMYAVDYSKLDVQFKRLN